MNQLLHLLMMLFCLQLVAGCTSVRPIHFEVKVDSINSPDMKDKKSYFILPGIKGISSDDLSYMEYKQYAEHALSDKGFEKASTLKKSDMAIMLTYGISDPKEVNYSVPIFGQTGISSSSTTGSVSSSGQIRTYTTHIPTYGVIGSMPASTSIYTRFVGLFAYDTQAFFKDNRHIQLWKTTAISTGITGDLRRVYPIIIAAMLPYLGTITGHQIDVILYEDSETVLKVKNSANAKYSQNSPEHN